MKNNNVCFICKKSNHFENLLRIHFFDISQTKIVCNDCSSLIISNEALFIKKMKKRLME
jgi:hypothetical protein